MCNSHKISTDIIPMDSEIQMYLNGPLFIISWNVNGYSDVVHIRVREMLNTYRPDVLFLSETKRTAEILHTHFQEFESYHVIVNPHTPAHHHGVAMLINIKNTISVVDPVVSIPPRS